MSVPPSKPSLEIVAVAAAVAQDAGAAVSVEVHGGHCTPMMPLQSFPGLVTEVYGLLPVETANNILPGLNRQCGHDLTIEVARRRRAGKGPLDRREPMAVQEGLADAGFDAFPADRIDRLWLTATSELRAAMMLLRWTAVLYRDVAAAELGRPDMRELSVIVAKHANCLWVQAEALLDSDAMRARIERIAEALRRGKPVSAEALTALTADIPRTVGVSDLSWPWLAQRLAACGSASPGPPGCPESSLRP
jgi:hypothetical protein